MEFASRFSDAECEALFAALFPHGFAGGDVIGEIAPAGYESSPLVAVFHPSAEQCYREAVQVHRNIESFFANRPNREPRPEPTFEEVAAEFRAEPVDVQQEVMELVGKCLWDVFSDNHEVVDRDDRVADLGSFRASGGFLADVANRHCQQRKYDYLDFYLGTMMVSQRADLSPVYVMIFRRLNQQTLDWIYYFPKLGLVDLRPLKKALDQSAKPDWAGYSPSEALAKQAEEEEHDRELAQMRESLEEGYRESVAAASENPPPTSVMAYRSVYGRFPRGWPPTCE